MWRIPSIMLITLLVGWMCGPMAPGQQPPGPSPGEARSRWVGKAATAKSDLYLLRTDLPEQYRPTVKRHIDGYYAAISDIFTLFGIPIQGRNEIWIFHDPNDYRAVFPELGTHVAGHFSPDSQVAHTFLPASSLNGTDDSFNRTLSTLLHEVTHQMLYQGFRNITPATMDERLPRWCNEGLAEFVSRGVPTPDGLFVGTVTNSDYARLLKMAESNRLFPLSRIALLSTEEWFAMTQSHDLYLQGWLAIHFFIYAEQGRYRDGLGQLLRQVSNGKTWKKAVSDTLGPRGFAQLDAAYQQFVSNLKPNDLPDAVRKAVFLAQGIYLLDNVHGQSTGGHPINEIRSRLAARNTVYEFGIDFGFSRIDSGNPRSVQLPLTGGTFHTSQTGGRWAKAGHNKGRDAVVWTEGLEPRNIRVSWNRREERWQIEAD